MKYMVKAYKKRTGKIQESQPFKHYSEAIHNALEFLKSEQYKVILILRDSEGEDHPANAGKFFLHRIVK